jgi:hypothetical protein
MRIVLFLFLLLAACGDDGDRITKPPAGEWSIGPAIDGRNYSVGLPASTNGSFDIGPTAEPHYVTKATGPLSDAAIIRFRYRIDGPADTTFTPCARVTPHFQKRGDDWKTEGYRWWATFAEGPLTIGEHEIAAPLDGKWTGVYAGTTAETHPAAFSSAKANAVRVGFTFGDCESSGHGAQADKLVRFTILAFDVSH